jgi:hypothetical protein
MMEIFRGNCKENGEDIKKTERQSKQLRGHITIFMEVTRKKLRGHRKYPESTEGTAGKKPSKIYYQSMM